VTGDWSVGALNGVPLQNLVCDRQLVRLVKIKSCFDPAVWQKAHELALLVFKMTERFPKADQFGIVSQVRRSCSSVPANSAEGFG
jgi:hypothetical protein